MIILHDVLVFASVGEEAGDFLEALTPDSCKELSQKPRKSSEYEDLRILRLSILWCFNLKLGYPTPHDLLVIEVSNDIQTTMLYH